MPSCASSCRSTSPSSIAAPPGAMNRRRASVQRLIDKPASIQSILSARLQTAFARSRPRRHRRYPHSAQPSRGFVQSGFYEVALTSALQVPPCHATSQNPPDSLERHNGAVTAVATVFIGVFTWVLACVSGRQARLTRESIELAREEFIATHRPKI